MSVPYDQDSYYRFSLLAKNWIATSGVMNRCEQNRCFWVLDTLASYVPTLAKTQGVDYFLIVQVEVSADQTAVFTIKQEDHDKGGDRYRVLVRQEIEYTDLSKNLTFWAINESAGDYNPACQTVVLLPEEY